MRQPDGLGLMIAKRREQLNMSQETLGFEAGLSTKTIKRIESGGQTKTENVMSLCDAWEISPNELFEYEDDPLAGLVPELMEVLTLYAMMAKKMNPVIQRRLTAKIRLEMELMK